MRRQIPLHMQLADLARRLKASLESERELSLLCKLMVDRNLMLEGENHEFGEVIARQNREIMFLRQQLGKNADETAD
jgi:hypothetical protein